jgi:hypothetical protein
LLHLADATAAAVTGAGLHTVGLLGTAFTMEQDRELKTGLGLDHFEGRSFTGWRRHVTLVTARAPVLHHGSPGPKSGRDGLTLYKILGELQLLLATRTGACPTCLRPVKPLHHNTRGPT